MMVSFNNPVVGVVVGTLFTALIQSSAASVAILQALSATGVITYGIAAPIVMGQNIGTCVTSMISSIGTNANAKRVACIHLSVNVIGTGFIMVVYGLANAFFELTFLSVSVEPLSIALIHTIFNVVIQLQYRSQYFICHKQATSQTHGLISRVHSSYDRGTPYP
jgi:phosphate:Na+ symporter